MPNKKGGEMPQWEKPEHLNVANDNVEKPSPDALAANDNEPQLEHPHEAVDNKALREMQKEIDDAEPGAVLFIGGITNPRAWDERREAASSKRAVAQGYEGKVEKDLAEREDIVFLSHDTVRGSDGTFTHGLTALISAMEAHPGKKIVVDSNFFLQEHLFKAWQENDADSFGSLGQGTQSAGTLGKWLADEANESTDAEHVSKSELLLERFQHMLEPLMAFSKKYGRTLEFMLAPGDPLAAAFFAFAAKASLEPQAVRETFREFHGDKRSTGIVSIKDGKIMAKLGEREFRKRGA